MSMPQEAIIGAESLAGQRCALVTGASSGIGEAIASRLLAEGWKVIGLSRSAPEFTDANFVFLPVDLLDSTALVQALAPLERVDAIIHAAGFMRTAALGALNEADGQAMWAVHVSAAATLVNALQDRLPDGGRMVLIGSRTAGGAAGRSQYSACKAALLGMARSWAAELVTRRITVNIVSPGATETPMLHAAGRAATPPKRPPMGSFIQPDEISGTVAFLLGPDAVSITGQQIIICGGGSL
jgi:3-oxoacyl-[acyl-carrier protein] reductase